MDERITAKRLEDVIGSPSFPGEQRAVARELLALRAAHAEVCRERDELLENMQEPEVDVGALQDLKRHARVLVGIFDGKSSPNRKLVDALNGMEDALEILDEQANGGE